MTAHDWAEECAYIERVTEKRGNVREMGYSLETFLDYCRMQQRSAERTGHDDSATYIQHCIDDLEAK